jgi:hypothetical protein
MPHPAAIWQAGSCWLPSNWKWLQRAVPVKLFPALRNSFAGKHLPNLGRVKTSSCLCPALIASMLAAETFQ